MRPIAYVYAAGGMGPEGNVNLDIFEASRVPLAADARPISLRALAKQTNAQTPRLVSRFVELAVLGARRIDGPIAPATRLYVATGMGEIVNNDAMYHQVVPPCGEMIMPARFVSSGNNMAAFFVARQAGLVSRNLTVSLEELSFEQALRIACDDLAAGAMREGLVGAVDETATPREFYLRHFPFAHDHVIGEGSAWVLLGADPDGAIGELLDVTVTGPDARRNPSTDDLRGMLSGDQAILLPGFRLDAEDLLPLLRLTGATKHHRYMQHTGYFPTAVGLALAGTFQAQWSAATTFIHLNDDEFGRCGRLIWRVYARRSRAQ